ncbi:hypothetical protein BGZ49_002689 [Haplosporangium sp. Z 27]|nr:hypothetical protein BGZ49_002689 [Haplosporangium sp. Z 27]
MGSDWYTFASNTIVGIPIPNKALESSYEKEGFRILIIKEEAYDDEQHKEYSIYHGAFLCLEDTMDTKASLEVIGPYEIVEHAAASERMGHLDKYLLEDVKQNLLKEYESFVKEKPKFAPGFWTISSTSNHNIKLYSKWAMPPNDKLASEDSEDSDRLFYSVSE